MPGFGLSQNQAPRAWREVVWNDRIGIRATKQRRLVYSFE